MSVYPRNMSAFLNRLSGYNKNNVKMNVLGSSSASAGDIIQVDLPTNSIVMTRHSFMTLIPSHSHTTVIRRAWTQMEAPEAVPQLVGKLGSRHVYVCMVEPLFSGSPARIRASLRIRTARDSTGIQY